MTPPFVIIEWDDAWADATTAVTLKDVGDSHRPEVIKTTGWLLKEDEAGVSLANEVCGDGSYRGRTFILKAMIRSVIRVNLAPIRKKAASAPMASVPST